MPLPSNFITFDDKNFAVSLKGFNVLGMSSLPRKFDFRDAGATIRPYTGSRFLVLDNPNAILGGPDGISGDRTEEAKRQAAPLRDHYINSTLTGDLTRGFDGAQLVCGNVQIAAGQTLSFMCRLGSYLKSIDLNDFATFSAVNGRNEYVVTTVLCDTEGLRNPVRFTNELLRNPMEWMPYSFHFPRAFNGTLVWTVANGQKVADRQEQVGSVAGCWPAFLALDHIVLSG